MKKNQIALLAALLFFTLSVIAQKDYSILLKDGIIAAQPNLTPVFIEDFKKTAFSYGKAYAMLQFENILTEGDKKSLAANGFIILDYIPNYAYTVSINQDADFSVLQRVKGRALIQLLPKHKMHPSLANGNIPVHAVKVIGTVDAWILFPKNFSADNVIEQLKKLNINVISISNKEHRIIEIRIASNRLNELASLPFIEYIQPIPAPDQPLNENSRNGSRANILNASISNGGKGLNGEGIVMGIGDNADVLYHIDFTNRFINRTYAPNSAAHGIHVAGTATGAGIINELYRGYAPKATFINQYFSGIIVNTPTYVNDYGMVVTNNSYGGQLGCDYNGSYDLTSRMLDQQAFDFPHLQHVFAAGNSGGDNCAPYPPGFRTVLGSYQSSKNIISVGNTTAEGVIVTASSKGPVKDGRLKPEIAAMGTGVVSGWNSNIYGGNNGTSMAAPAVTGGLALLYQRYRQLHNNANPKSGLMKALLCNGATDKGNVGPDFSYGYGWMNLLRSIDMLEKSRYFNSTVSNANTNTHTITIPANTAQLKVMLYWHDPAGSMLSSKALVHDLDLEVTDANNATRSPAKLDTSIANLTAPATLAADHENNMEQVVFKNPTAGNFSIKVKGTAVGQTSEQEYFVVYDIIPVETKLTYPVGGEGLVPGETVKIQWESYGDPENNFTLQYSADGGVVWIDINTNIDAALRQYNWVVPAIATEKALVRIVRNGTAITHTSNPFTIVGLPVVSLAAIQCEGYINISWTSVSGATDYEVMMLRNGDMASVATTTSNNYTFTALNKDSVYWVTVRPRVNSKPGRRAVAIQRQPNNGTCAGSFSDNDLKLAAIISPKTGRANTYTQLSASTSVTIQIKNLDDVAVSNASVQYSIDGGNTWSPTETISNISAGSTLNHTFSQTANLAATGNYHFVAIVKLPGDAVSSNDTLRSIIKHLPNAPIDIANQFLDNIEDAGDVLYQVDTVGLNGLERYDFENSHNYGRLRTFVNSGVAFSGTKALTLDLERYYVPGNTNYLYGTYNLSNYNTSTTDVRLDFRYNNHGQTNHPNNKVWIRGSDTQPWIEAYDLDNEQEDPGIYKKTYSIEVSDLLANSGQNFTSSFQVRWGQFGQVPATDRYTAAGYSFDDIKLYPAIDDIQMMSIDTPIVSSCGLSNAVPVKISIRNSANNTINNIPVKYRVNNGAWSNGVISSISGNATVQFTFPGTADLSAVGNHSIEAVVEYATDNFRENDTVRQTIVNSPIIASYPYLQNFESSNGNWYAGGKKGSWEYGIPASSKINGAASGAKAWKTSLVGNYNDNEHSFLYSPCFDVSGLTAPTLSFSVALDIEDCGAQLCDAVWLEYSGDGKIWKKLGVQGSGTNWYNKADQLWSIQNYTRWHVATAALPPGIPNLRFRFVMLTDPGVSREGIAIDDIHIYDNTKGIYDGVTISSPITQNVTGNNWVHFENNGKLVASVQANSQSLGATGVKVFINNSIRNANNQYYHNRNLVINPANNSLTDSVTVRFYFLDSETETLINATGCSTCYKPSNAYQLGVSKYSDIDDAFENGTVSDNNQGHWSFLKRENITIVPFDKGYYAEFKVKDFSEFWLNSGGLDKSTPLPVKLLDFTVQKAAGDGVLVKWQTTGETNVLKYEIELAKSDQDLAASNFIKIGELESKGPSTIQLQYSFTDAETPKLGVRYYRLKIIDNDGAFKYSKVQSVIFNNAEVWQLYPNPSTGVFHLVYQVSNGEEMNISITDASGKLVHQGKQLGNGYLQKAHFDLTGRAAGVYLLQIKTAGKTYTNKLYKQ